MSVRTRNYCSTGFVYTSGIMPGSGLENLRILHNWGVGQNMPSKYATTSNVCYDENIMMSNVHHGERGSIICSII